MTRVLALAAAVTFLACSAAPAQQPSSPAPTDVAARIGDRAITVRELDERWQKDDPAQNAEATQTIYDGRKAALDAIIADSLVAQAAKASGMSADGYLEAEISKRVKPVTDSDVSTFFTANQSQMQGRSLDVMSTPISRFLTDSRRASARDEIIGELRKKGPAIRVALEAPRMNVAVSDANPAVGSASAPVTLIEFSDYQCPYCGRVEPTLKRLRATYGAKLRFVWKDFPLTQIHPLAFKAAEAAHCAGDQGKYWQLHDLLFSKQTELQVDDLKRHALTAGLNTVTFNECLDSSKYGERVRDGVAEGGQLGVNSTPTVFINGRRLSGAQPYEAFAAVIDEELAKGR